jgi:hypothetical protein
MIENRQARRSLRSGCARAVSRLRPSASHLLTILIAFLALTIQNLVVQTHIHIPQMGGRVQTVSLMTLAAAALSDKPHAAGDVCTESTPHDKYPINEDPSNCPLCQEIAYSGQFVHSGAVLDALPSFVTVSFIVFDEALPSLFRSATSGRAEHPRKPNST